MSHKILITGASGGLGGGVLDNLLKLVPADRLVALGRNGARMERFAQAGVEVCIADFDDAAATEKALTGMHTVYLVPTAAPNRMEQHQRVIDTARRTGVQQFIYSGVIHHGEVGQGAIVSDHQQTEQAIIASGIPHTLVRNALYLDVLPMILGNAAGTGVFAYPVAPNGVSLASRADMAEATARIIADPALHGRPHALSSPTAITYAQVAEAYSRVIGKPVRHHDVSMDEHQQHLIAAGIPAPMIPFMVGMARALAEGVIREPGNTLADLLGRTPKTVEQALREAAPAPVGCH
ncbi:MAG: NmrA family NAD(P)-binding protein [Flavobacteriales bacterium]|nr:NmrA family NAD(P)-binding protein [Flavobacteriales bacterium]